MADLTPDAARIEEELRAHILARYAAGTGYEALDPDADLLGTGVVDSVGVMELTGYLDEAFGIAVADEDIVPENFRSLRSMTQLVAAKKGIPLEAEAGEDDRAYGFVERVRELVLASVPTDAVVLVVSRGDDALLQLHGRTGWHFPRDESGEHPGFNPADGADALAQLEAQRAQGATHLVFPETELWWLDEYSELRESLAAEVARSDAGAVYAL
jgi:acyl carrier protein